MILLIYIGEIIQKKKIFQRHFEVAKNKVLITDRTKSKVKFLKSDIKNVVFREDLAEDNIFKSHLEKAYLYDREFVLNYLEGMMGAFIAFNKAKVPMDEIAVFSTRSEDIVKKCCRYAKVVTVIGSAKGKEMYEGVVIRYQKKMKSPPNLIINEGEKRFSSVFKVPVIDIGENPIEGSMNINTISFEADLFDFEINLPTLIYFLKKGEIEAYRVTSYRKKSTALFTFS